MYDLISGSVEHDLIKKLKRCSSLSPATYELRMA